MVKNTTGGNKSKGIARKNLVKRDTALRIAKEDGEIYAQAVKVMGGALASAIDVFGNPLTAHIRGKFRGRGKRDNFIGPNTWLLVGLHSWENSEDKMKKNAVRNCDILEVYSETDKQRLINSVIGVNWKLFLENDAKGIQGGNGNVANKCGTEIVFSNDANEDLQALLQTTKNAESSIVGCSGDINGDEEINVDDI